jgi:elongator complex protein 3
MGVQNPSDEIYSLVGRTHSVQDVVEATQIMKDAGLKVAYHMMPGLPGSDQQKDLEAFKTIFNDDNFRPDMIKIYPCLVLKETKTYGWYSKGTYQPYTNEQAADLIVEIKKIVPHWVRIMRVQRDIPAPLIVAGVNKSNLRQIAQEKLAQEHVKCRCIRCREIGHRAENHNTRTGEGEINITTTRYGASEGEEVFISVEAEEGDSLIGYLRLRIPSEKAHRAEVIAEPCSIVRELHIYGSLVPVGKHFVNAWQHKGCGTILLTEAQRISCEDYDLRKVLIISGLGTKQYYRRLGYSYDGVYMSKDLDELK